MSRPNLGHIKRLGHNHYKVQWSSGYKPDGKRSRPSKTLHCTRQEAEVFLARQIGFGERETSSILWGEFWAVYVEQTYEGLAKRTIDDYQKLYAKYLAPHIATLSVAKTDELQVDLVLSQINSPTTQRHVKDLWRKACKIAVRRKLLPYCPIDSNTPLKPLRASKKRLLDASEVFIWLEGIKGSKYELALLVMLGGGLRPEEAYGLNYTDFSQFSTSNKEYVAVSVSRALTYSHGKVLKDTKNGFSEREVIIGKPFASRVADLLSKSCQELSKTGHLGQPIVYSGKHGKVEQYSSPSTICNNYRLWCERKNTIYVPPKNLRASYATMHGEAGSPDSLVSGSMGHSDGTTRGKYYQEITRRGLILIADNLAEFLQGFEQGK